MRDFISIIERHGEIAGLSNDKLPPYVIQYCSEEVKRVIRWNDELDGSDWGNVKELLTSLYGSSDEPSSVTIDHLRDFVKEARGKRDFTKRSDVDRYHREFLSIAGHLKKKGELSDTEMQLKFLAGLPSGTRAFVTTRLPEANKEVKNPPTITQMIKIICDRFNPKSIESYGYESEDDEDAPIIAKPPHITLTHQPTITEPVALPNLTQTTNHSGKSNSNRPDIDALAQQLQQLSLSQAQLMTMLNGLSSQPSSNNVSADKRCFICGLSGTHRLHPRHCPETAKLMAEGLLVFLPDRQRYALPDGSDLPVLPFNSGGIAKHLRERRTPGVASTSVGTLFIGHTQAIQGGAIGIDASDYEELISGAVTRTGKDTNTRHDPYKRPDATKPKEHTFPSMIKKPATNPVAQPQPQTESQTAPTASTVPKPHPINTEEGWKKSRQPNKTRDIEMKDAKDEPKKGTPQYHFTSDIQEQVSPDVVMKAIMNQTISLSLRDIIGISPILQKKFNEVTKTRREYTTKSGEYELYSPEVEYSLAQAQSGGYSEARRTLYIPDADEFQSFMVRHSNAVQLRPTKMLAMTTGVFTAKLCGQMIKFMVDTGSELNLIPERLLTLPGLALDFEGSRWALKGVNGAPVGLKGCCMDVPVQIGHHDFDHHFFVSREDMRSHDAILGQPWIQWYAARIDFDREGTMKMMVWHDGDRSNQPTLQLQLTIPDDPRNVTTFRRHVHFAEVEQEEEVERLFRAAVEEVSEDEDSHF